MSLITNLSSAQSTITEVETYIFAGIMKSENKLSEFIELNESNDTTRYWKFNEKHQLIKEIDNRPSIWPYSAGWQSSVRLSSKVYDYEYHLNGKLDRVTEVHKSEGEIIKTLHTFSYPNENTINEFYKIDSGELLRFDFLLSQVMNGSNIEESTQTMKHYIGDGYLETIQRLEYIYDKGELLKQKNHYFSINGFPEKHEQDQSEETLSAKSTYTYDASGRLQRIKELEYTENENYKLISDIILKYKSQSQKIERINIIYGENYTPNLFEYIIQYEVNGDLKSIVVNEQCYTYISIR